MAVVHGEAKWTHLVAAADGTYSAWLAGWLAHRRGELDAARKIYADAFGDGIVPGAVRLYMTFRCFASRRAVTAYASARHPAADVMPDRHSCKTKNSISLIAT